MSSVIAFLRALIMVACLVAVPVLAISHGTTISRGLQAAARFLDRISADASPSDPEESVLQGGALRSARPTPMPVAGSSQAATSDDVPPPALLPEPLADRDRRGPSNPSDPEPAGTRTESADRPLPAARHEAQVPPLGSQVANWEEAAAALQDLGALEYALEKWGDSGELYRFRCLATVPGTSSYQRHFHAVDADGGRAVERVVEQVRAWREGATRAQ